MTTDTRTYRIEARDARYGWTPAPGESAGWTLDAAREAVAGGLYWLDGSAIEEARIVCEQDGSVVDAD